MTASAGAITLTRARTGPTIASTARRTRSSYCVGGLKSGCCQLRQNLFEIVQTRLADQEVRHNYPPIVTKSSLYILYIEMNIISSKYTICTHKIHYDELQNNYTAKSFHCQQNWGVNLKAPKIITLITS